MEGYAQGQVSYDKMGPDGPPPQRESACSDANRLVGKLESALGALDQIKPHPKLDMAPTALGSNEPGLLDALDRAFHLANQIDSRIREIAELVGRV
jgi:hypothetical protein